MISKYTGLVLLGIFLVALLGTLVETGAGFVQGIIERIEAVISPGGDKALSQRAKATIGVATLMLGTLIGSMGIVASVAKGYSTLSVGFALVYIIPIFSLSVFNVMKARSETT